MQNKKGFSFIELILILVFFFMILAALMPMITRRHLAPPERVSHGTYACYRGANGELRETLMRGKHTIISDQPAGADGCKFEAPKKANYFYVQLIGGGGGGRDLDWDTDVNPAPGQNRKSDYRIFGKREKTGDNDGYFVHYGSGTNLRRAWPEDSELRGLSISDLCQVFNTRHSTHSLVNQVPGCDFLGTGLINDVHLLYLHSQTRNGLISNNTTGQIEDKAICRTESTTKNCSVSQSSGKTYQPQPPGSSSHYYSFDCADTNNDKVCDNPSVCTDEILTCNDGSTISFSAEVSMKSDTCKNNTSDSYSKGNHGYIAIPMNNALAQALVEQGSYYTRYDSNHTNCGTPSRYPVTTNTTDLIAKYYDKGLKNQTAVTNPNRGQQSGVWFQHRLGSGYGDDYLLYLCGGWSAEKAITVGDSANNRSKDQIKENNDPHCAPVYGKPNPSTPQRRAINATLSILGYIKASNLASNTTTANNYQYSASADQLPAIVTNTAPSDSNRVYHHDYRTTRLIKVKLSQTQEIPYGIGGRAGEVKTLVLKSIPSDVRMVPGMGGARGQSGQPGQDGQPTIFGGGAADAEISEKVAQGGRGGTEIVAREVPIGPIGRDGVNIQRNGNWRDFTTESGLSRRGGTISYSTFVKFIISRQDPDMKRLMEGFGRGGGGAYTKTDATCGYNYVAFALEDTHKVPSIINSYHRPGRNDEPGIDAGTFQDPSKNTFCGNYQWVKIPRAAGASEPDYDTVDPRIPINDYVAGYYIRRGTSGNSMSDHALHIVAGAEDGNSGAIVISW